MVSIRRLGVGTAAPPSYRKASGIPYESVLAMSVQFKEIVVKSAYRESGGVSWLAVTMVTLMIR